MNFIMSLLFLTSLFHANVKITSAASNESTAECIDEDHIFKPVGNWDVLNKNMKMQNNKLFIEATFHNPMSKDDKSVDARFIILTDINAPNDVSKYRLMSAIYYNKTSNVIFKRISIIQDVMKNKKMQHMLMETECFSRTIVPIMQLEPATFEIKNITPGKKEKS